MGLVPEFLLRFMSPWSNHVLSQTRTSIICNKENNLFSGLFWGVNKIDSYLNKIDSHFAVSLIEKLLSQQKREHVELSGQPFSLPTQTGSTLYLGLDDKELAVISARSNVHYHSCHGVRPYIPMWCADGPMLADEHIAAMQAVLWWKISTMEDAGTRFAWCPPVSRSKPLTEV